MRVAILQPGYLPWIGFFDQMQQSDTFVILDDVQYDKHSWRNRNRIKTAQGTQWLSVPILTAGKNWPKINEVGIDNHINWRDSHLKSIRQNYSRAPFFSKYIRMLEKTYERQWTHLINLSMSLILDFRQVLGIKTQMLKSSSMQVEGDREHRLINICKKLGADEFLEGSAGRDYLEGPNTQMFLDNGIKIVYHDYQHPTYPQLYGEFVPYLSIVDLLMNCGPDSLRTLASKNDTKDEVKVA